MTVPFIELASDDVAAVIDPGYGADILSLIDLRSGVDVLFRSPWRERADAIRAGGPASSSDPSAGWLERYRGGWQTLCPNSGDPRSVHGAPVGFHGEVSRVAWGVDSVAADSATLHVELFTVPVRIDRRIELLGTKLSITDTLTNLSDGSLEFDYSHHPAFGGAFLDGDCRIDSGATRFTSDPERPGSAAPGSVHEWPAGVSTAGATVDLRRIPGPDEPMEVFGWLSDFTGAWATITNVDLGLSVRLEWDGERLPYAWLWQELNGSDNFPWYRRARVVAIEPASTQTSGPDRRSVLSLGPRASAQISISISLENGAANG